MARKIFELPYIDGDYDSGDFYIYYTTTGDMSSTIKIRNSVTQYSGSIDAYNNFHTLYMSLIKTLGEGYILQKQDVFLQRIYHSPKANEFLQEKYNEHFDNRKYVDVVTYLTITKPSKKKFFSFDEKSYKEFNQTVRRFFDILHGANAQPVILDKKSVSQLVKQVLTLNFSSDKIVLNNMKPSEEDIDMGDKVLRCLPLVDTDNVELPNTIGTYSEMTEPVTMKGFPIDMFGFLRNVPNFKTIIYNQVITLPNQRSTLLDLEKKQRKHSGIPDANNLVCVEDIGELLKEVAKDGKFVVNAHYDILVAAERKFIDRATDSIITGLNNHGITPSRNAYNQLELFRTALPGNGSALGKYDLFLTTCEAAVCFLFKEALPVNESDDFVVRFTDRWGIPLTLAPAKAHGGLRNLDGRNKFILGPTGSGKSFFMNSYLEQCMLHNFHIVIVDTGNSYKGLNSYFKGEYITYTKENPITMNPFAISEKEFDLDKRNFLVSLIGILWKTKDGELSTVERDIISQIMINYYQSYFHGFQGLTKRQLEKIGDKVRAEIPRQEIEKQVKKEIEYLSSVQTGDEFKHDLYKKHFEKLFNERFKREVEIQSEMKEKEFEENKVRKLGFDSFYHFASYYIPQILEEESTHQQRLEFNFVDFRFVLSKFCTGGEFGETLNKDVDKSLFDQRFIVFEIDNIKNHATLFPIVTLIIMDIFLQKLLTLKGFRKALIIEEAWKAIASPIMANYLVYLYKTARKHWGEAITVTQELGDLVNSPIVKATIVDNSDILVLLDHSRKQSTFEPIANLLSLNETEQRKIFTINQLDNKANRSYFKEFYMKRGLTGDVYGNEVSIYQYLAFTTEAPEKSAVDIYVHYYANYKDALINFVEDLNASGLKLDDFFRKVNALGCPVRHVPENSIDVLETA